MTRQKTIRQQLAPLMRAYGQNALARDSGVHVATINRWLNQTKAADHAEPPRLYDSQIEAICRVLGVRIDLTKRRGKG